MQHNNSEAMLSMKKSIKNENVIPLVDGHDLFDVNSESQYAIGMFSGSEIQNYKNNPLVEAYLRLRANVYVDQTNILGSDSKNEDGLEIDENDSESAHFLVCERRLGSVAVFASMRMIKKDDNDRLLPVEEDFDGGLFESVEKGSFEISRFIVRHPEQKQADTAKVRLVMAGLAYALANSVKPLNVYAEVEARFKRSLRAFGVASEAVSNPQLFQEGGFEDGTNHMTELVAIKINTDALEEKFGAEAIKKAALEMGEFSYWGEAKDKEK